MKLNVSAIRQEGREFPRKLLTKAFVPLLAGTLLILTDGTADAQPKKCDDVGNGAQSSLQNCSVDLNAKQLLLINAVDNLITELDNGPLAPQLRAQDDEPSEARRQLEKLKIEHGRGHNALEETSDDDYEEMVAQGAKVKGKKCNKWEEAEGVALAIDDYVPAGVELAIPNNPNRGSLGNGECDAFFVRDLQGGATYWIRERSQPNICVRGCEDDAQEYPDPNDPNNKKTKKEKMRGRFVDRMTENIDETDEAAFRIDEVTSSIETINLIAPQFGASYAFASVYSECDLASETPDIETAALYGTKIGLIISKRIMEGITLVAESLELLTKNGCQQDILGANTSSACIPLTAATVVAKGLVIVIDAALDGVTLYQEGKNLFTADATLLCAERMAEEQAAIKGIVSATNTLAGQIQQVLGPPDPSGLTIAARIARLEKLVIYNQEYIKNTRLIVLTPHGRREDVPLYEPPDSP